MNVNFEPYYDAFHMPYFKLESILMKFIPFRLSTPLVPSAHAKFLPFMQPELPIMFILIYFGICYLGRQRSSRFDHPWFKFLVNVYNAFLVVLSAFMVSTITIETTRLGYTWFNNPIDESVNARNLAKALSIFYLSKYPELLDTVIMAIKGNTRQISFLHIYHHSSIIFIWYVVTFTTPYSEAYFCALQNCAVHTLMYSYYLLTSMKMGSFFTKRIKKYMTLMQMVPLNNVDSIYAKCSTMWLLLVCILQRRIKRVSYLPVLLFNCLHGKSLNFVRQILHQ
eukprot:NODE_229_length_13800_cov_0.838114.p5 type:complete len:281 gc:universal NODE_229_length_13800_cov_0.838114:10232-11074(+)